MKCAVSVTLIACLMASAGPAVAQNQGGGEPLSPGGETVQQSDKVVQSDWWRVHKLASGTKIIVTLKGWQPSQRYFVAVDDFDLTVLNLADLPLPAAANEVLLAVASNHPEYFSAAQQGGTFVLEKGVRLRRDGVSVGDRKVADLSQVVANLTRTDVAEIRTLKKGRGFWGHLGPLGGYVVGALSGGFVAGFACQAAAGRDRCDTGAFLTGALVGGIAGGGYGFRAARRETEVVIYDAPLTDR